MSYIASTRQKLYYPKSVIVQDKRTKNLKNILLEIITELRSTKCNVIACVGDNAANIQASLKLLSAIDRGVVFRLKKSTINL